MRTLSSVLSIVAVTVSGECAGLDNSSTKWITAAVLPLCATLAVVAAYRVYVSNRYDAALPPHHPPANTPIATFTRSPPPPRWPSPPAPPPRAPPHEFRKLFYSRRSPLRLILTYSAISHEMELTTDKRQLRAGGAQKPDDAQPRHLLAVCCALLPKGAQPFPVESRLSGPARNVAR